MKRLRNSVIKWLVFALVCLLLGFLLGRFKQALLIDKIALMTTDIATIKTRNERLETDFERLNIMSISKQQTVSSLIESNKQLQDELTIASNKLFFYERVISPDLKATGVKVYSFDITKNNQTNVWDYELVLMQSQKGRHVLKGKFKLYLSIFEGEVLKKIALSELTDKPINNFKFKYFQTIKGSFSLPEKMTVDEVILQLNVAGNRWYKAQNIEERYDWQVLTTKDNVDLGEFDSSESSVAP